MRAQCICLAPRTSGRSISPLSGRADAVVRPNRTHEQEGARYGFPRVYDKLRQQEEADCDHDLDRLPRQLDKLPSVHSLQTGDLIVPDGFASEPATTQPHPGAKS
jgi:hypothetical protein